MPHPSPTPGERVGHPAGKERDAETGLDYFGARYYSNGLGRFISADWSATPVPVPYAAFADPQSLNLYSYVRNVPTAGLDPDGHGRSDESGLAGGDPVPHGSCWKGLGCYLASGPQDWLRNLFQAATNAQPNPATANPRAQSGSIDKKARRQQTVKKITMFIKGVGDFVVEGGKVVAGAGVGLTAETTEPLAVAGAIYGSLSGTGQSVQGLVEMGGAVTGHVKDAEEMSNALTSTTTVTGFITLLATHGDTKLGADAGNFEQLGTSALRGKLAEQAIDNILAFYDIVTNGPDK